MLIRKKIFRLSEYILDEETRDNNLVLKFESFEQYNFFTFFTKRQYYYYY